MLKKKLKEQLQHFSKAKKPFIQCEKKDRGSHTIP